MTFPEGYFPKQVFEKPISSDLYRKGPCYAAIVYQKVSHCVIILQGLGFLKASLMIMNLWVAQAVTAPHQPRVGVLQFQSLLLWTVDSEGGL